jgi:ribosomal protein S18 acetylase RimI-like enzyme
MSLSLRPASSGDDELLYAVYASTRAQEMALMDWNAAQKQEFLRMQYRAQKQAYAENYQGADIQLILLDGQPIGRLYVDRTGEEIHVLDISLLPQYRGQGIGTYLLNKIMKEAAEHNRPVTLYVQQFNPALHFYERLGFRHVSDQGVYLFMKWLAPVLETNDEDTRAIAK